MALSLPIYSAGLFFLTFVKFSKQSQSLPIYSAGLFCLTLMKFSKLSLIVLINASFFPKQTHIMLSTLSLKSGKTKKEYSKTCVKLPLSKRPKMVSKTNYRKMQVKSVAGCSIESILQYF